MLHENRLTVTPLSLLILSIESSIKWPIMNRFQILRCLWKHLDKTLQSIIFEFKKTTSLVAKNVTKKNFWDFSSSIYTSLKLLYSLCFSTYIKIVHSTWFYGPSTTTLTHKIFIWTMFVTQSFGLKITYFGYLHSKQKMPPPSLLNRIWNNVCILTLKVSK